MLMLTFMPNSWNYAYLDWYKKHFIDSMHTVSCGTKCETSQSINMLEWKIESGLNCIPRKLVKE